MELERWTLSKNQENKLRCLLLFLSSIEKKKKHTLSSILIISVYLLTFN